jgi:5-methylcytosine-specific restriction protein A
LRIVVRIGETIDNRTLCDVFGVANMGGIRVSKARSHIVLISNNTDPTYRNEWQDGTLHFVGMGSVGPQKLDREVQTGALRDYEKRTQGQFLKGPISLQPIALAARLPGKALAVYLAIARH